MQAAPGARSRAIDDSTMTRSGRASPPSLLVLTAHVLDGEHHLLAVPPNPKGDQRREGGRLTIEPHLDHRVVEDQAEDVVAGEITPLSGLQGGAGPPSAASTPPRWEGQPKRTDRVLRRPVISRAIDRRARYG